MGLDLHQTYFAQFNEGFTYRSAGEMQNEKHGRDPDLQVLSMFFVFLISKTA
ncbi:hypothetical protein CLOBOL_04925 [Enterocloster bolteae ATCC BAA-613]|uniref:Uncharacterized protein n=1 Tax=Enterocloster bolteae (strain ATCC BAA-613 / DSM 15670 / CCUG 46953 / JCM 12243 / WAL 16351) TaxID=411902 RepID=A8RXR3_ENTBW|nr:hypothetical protein CLOBOL_04925 [Enterocloster bolteae ATCC BAA-613]